MRFKTLKFTTDWKLFTLEERLAIVKVQGQITRDYERHANPDYFKKGIGYYLSGRYLEDDKRAKENK